jgi:hypothetical protein
MNANGEAVVGPAAPGFVSDAIADAGVLFGSIAVAVIPSSEGNGSLQQGGHAGHPVSSHPHAHCPPGFANTPGELQV